MARKDFSQPFLTTFIVLERSKHKSLVQQAVYLQARPDKNFDGLGDKALEHIRSYIKCSRLGHLKKYLYSYRAVNCEHNSNYLKFY